MPPESNITDTRALRDSLGRFATGIAIVTTLDVEGLPIGLTINSFSSVSLNPPLVLWSLDNRSAHLEDFKRASHYVINILSSDQEMLSNTFASPANNRFDGLAWQAGAGGAPLLPNCLAQFQVRNSQQMAGGDHLIFMGDVEHFTHRTDAEPLLYYAGRYARLGE